MKKLTEEEIEFAIRSTKGSLAMEGLESPPEVIEICKKLLRGEITKEQSTKEILKYHGIKKNPYK